jgi:4-amino-4-deoxychorismate lyase
VNHLVNGRRVEWPTAVGSALVHGEGVFRTLLVWDGAIVDAEAQHAILEGDAQRLGLTAGPLAAWLTDSVQALGGAPCAALRWWLARDGEGVAVRWVATSPLPVDRPARFWTQGIQAAVSPVRLLAPVELAGIKHLNRLPQRLAGRDWLPDQSEALMCDASGHLVCGTRSNLFWVANGELFTPLLDRVGVRGLMHRKITQTADLLGLRLHSARAEPEQLNDVEELFVTNSLIGLWPIRALGARQWSAPGPVTRALSAALQHPLADHMQGQPCAD